MKNELMNYKQIGNKITKRNRKQKNKIKIMNKFQFCNYSYRSEIDKQK